MNNEQILTLEEHLASFVGICDEYKQLYAAWTTGKRNLVKILSNVSLVFPHYSLHDDSHAQSILRNIERILGTERIKTLKPTEVWLLLMSAYSHDIGMLVKHKELCEVWSSLEFDDYLNDIMSNPKQSELREYAKYFKDENFKMKIPSDFPVQLKWAVMILSADYFRKKHADMGYKIITDMDNYGLDFKIDFSFNKFIPERIIYLLGEIAKLHGKTFDDVKKLHFCTNGIGLSDDYVYPRRIAELIRLGDLLDLDNGRFNENTYKLFGDMPETTLANREKHKAIRHFLVCDNCIEVTADCPDENSYQAVRDWFDWLHNEIQNLSLHWHEIMPENFGTTLPLPKLQILLNGKELKGDSLLRFNFKTEHIFELLEGANIYKNTYSFFRELIQNSIDSSKLHLWLILCNGTYDVQKEGVCYIPSDIPKEIFDSFTIKINIKYDNVRGGYKVSIRDKGIGFTEPILNEMQNIAQSWKERKEWKKIINDMPAWLRPTGGFGLGLQSVFKVTDSIQCLTKSIDGVKKRITFRSREKNSRISYEIIDSSFNEGIETTISFFIPIAKTHVRTYKLGGLFYREVNTFNPFEQSDVDSESYLNLMHMLECIQSDIGEVLFPLVITIEVDDFKNEIMIDRPSYTNFNKNKMKYDGNYVANIDFSKMTMILYDILESISINIKFVEDGEYGGVIKLLFKGMRIDDPMSGYMENYLYRYVSIVIGLDGLDAKEYLTLSREKLRDEKRSEIGNIIIKDIKYAISILLNHIGNNQDVLHLLSTGQLARICGIYEKFFKKKFFFEDYMPSKENIMVYNLIVDKFLDGSIEVYNKSDENENFLLSNINIREVLKKYRNGSYFNILIKYDTNRIEETSNTEQNTDIVALKHFSKFLNKADEVFTENINYFLAIRNIDKIYKTNVKENLSYFLVRCSNRNSNNLISEMMKKRKNLCIHKF